MKHQPLRRIKPITNQFCSLAKTTHTGSTSDITSIDFDKVFWLRRQIPSRSLQQRVPTKDIISTNEAGISITSNTLAASSEAQDPLKNNLFSDIAFNEITNVDAKFTKSPTTFATPSMLDQTNFLSTIAMPEIITTEEGELIL